MKKSNILIKSDKQLITACQNELTNFLQTQEPVLETSKNNIWGNVVYQGYQIPSNSGVSYRWEGSTLEDWTLRIVFETRKSKPDWDTQRILEKNINHMLGMIKSYESMKIRKTNHFPSRCLYYSEDWHFATFPTEYDLVGKVSVVVSKKAIILETHPEIEITEKEMEQYKKVLAEDRKENARIEKRLRKEKKSKISEDYKKGVLDVVRLLKENGNNMQHAFPNNYILDKDIIWNFLEEKGING